MLETPKGVALSQPRVERRERMRTSRNPGVPERFPFPNPEGVALRIARESIPDVSFVNLKTVSLAELTKFIFERHAFVPLLLVGDVSFDLFDIGLADRKGPVSPLPLEILQRSMLFL